MKLHSPFQEISERSEETSILKKSQNEHQAVHGGSVGIPPQQQQGSSCKLSKHQSQLQESQL